MSEMIANWFSVLTATFAFVAALMYGYIIWKRNNRKFRYLSWFSLLLALWTCAVFIYIAFFVNSADARAKADLGPNLIRPTILLYMALLGCKAIARIFTREQTRE
jgi:peptidoglycan/LPS O-acetylase OafA/YrhL